MKVERSHWLRHPWLCLQTPSLSRSYHCRRSSAIFPKPPPAAAAITKVTTAATARPIDDNSSRGCHRRRGRRLHHQQQTPLPPFGGAACDRGNNQPPPPPWLGLRAAGVWPGGLWLIRRQTAKAVATTTPPSPPLGNNRPTTIRWFGDSRAVDRRSDLVGDSSGFNATTIALCDRKTRPPPPPSEAAGGLGGFTMQLPADSGAKATVATTTAFNRSGGSIRLTTVVPPSINTVLRSKEANSGIKEFGERIGLEWGSTSVHSEREGSKAQGQRRGYFYILEQQGILVRVCCKRESISRGNRLLGGTGRVIGIFKRVWAKLNSGQKRDVDEIDAVGVKRGVPMHGKRFTRISDNGSKLSKLDRFLVSNSFGDFWKNLGVKALERKWSDHIPIVLENSKVDYGPSPFKFFNAWLKEDSLEDVVRNAWVIEVRAGNPDRRLDADIKSFKEEASRLEKKAESDGWVEEEKDQWLEARRSGLELEKKKLEMLRQKAKLKWNLEGDENTKLFHTSVNNRARRNSLKEDSVKPRLRGRNTKRISCNDAIGLEAPFGEEEVWEAIKSCGSNKSPGPDGFTFRFVKDFWGLIKGDVMGALNWLWEKEDFSPGCNAAFLTLIPKMSSPEGVGDFRPISLIGVFYKIVAKVLAERLKKVMSKLISPTQTAFINKRQILDGALIANEIVEFLRKKRQSGLIFKVDFEKAYDSVDWGCLLETLEIMAFGKKWIGWIHACLRTSSVSVLINGSPTKEFVMEKGLRQGDPMAPFLFLIVAENLNLLMEEAVDKECFRLLSGMKINMRKSKLYGVRIEGDVVDAWARGAGCVGGNLPFTYLGIPVGASMRKVESWKPVIEKLKGGLAIGSLATMNQALLAKWWWRFLSENGALWLKVIKSLYGSRGGLEGGASRVSGGFSAWRNVLRVVKELDDLGTNFSGSFRRVVGEGKETSFWKDRWLGESNFLLAFPRLARLEVDLSSKIADKSLWVEDRWVWNWSWRRVPRGREIGELVEFERVLSGWSPVRGRVDKWEWSASSDGTFSTKKVRELLGEGERVVVEGGGTEWCSVIPRKVNVFMWRARLDRLPTRAFLDKLGVDLDSLLCPRCSEYVEDIDHALFKCAEIANLWSRVKNWWNIASTLEGSLAQFLLEDAALIKASKGKHWWVGLKWSLLYLVWKQRNDIVFKGVNCRINDLFFEWQRVVFEWLSHRSKNGIGDWFRGWREFAVRKSTWLLYVVLVSRSSFVQPFFLLVSRFDRDHGFRRNYRLVVLLLFGCVSAAVWMFVAAQVLFGCPLVTVWLFRSCCLVVVVPSVAVWLRFRGGLAGLGTNGGDMRGGAEEDQDGKIGDGNDDGMDGKNAGKELEMRSEGGD
ncbi:hypothetical protein OSB04_005023 [Centaurea solstitialis]|uniref:Reverse transcriptase domain-containing protein n=1 Tax=Centaurea solstitialis TaxID=347529 RepID=A0AA38TMT3_9ASTR|nr:hypothetical protein OSB04_005023 [Centaurea solstitialis]